MNQFIETQKNDWNRFGGAIEGKSINIWGISDLTKLESEFALQCEFKKKCVYGLEESLIKILIKVYVNEESNR